MAIVSRLNNILKQGGEFIIWVLAFGCFPMIFFILGLLLLFWMSFKVFQPSFHGGDLMQFLCDFKGRFDHVRGGFWLKTSLVEIWDSKTVQTCRNRRLNWLKKNGFLFSKLNLAAYFKWGVDLDSDVGIEEKEDVDSEDGEFDVVKLRELVKMERKNKEDALEELEREKMAAASAAEEAMAMIYRLQREKSEIVIKADQFHRMMEVKQQYDQEVIDYLQRFIMDEYEFEGSLSEQPLIVGDGASRFRCNMEFVLEDDDAQMNNID